jgi:tRNA threonylcarbamoyladenosine biosynthesis protein TsaB
MKSNEMALILSIDTAGENAGICLAEDGKITNTKTNSNQMDHAAWIHTAIEGLLNEASREINEINAVAVTSGPGSYTGLRVGMATAKGLCFVLNVPLITESTLMLSAKAVKEKVKSVYSLPIFYCPMIDARRMEVFTALYDAELQEITPPSALVLDESLFHNELEHRIIVFSGNGSGKWQTICKHRNAVFSEVIYTVSDLAVVAWKKYQEKNFADLAYTEPLYVKNVYTGLK